MNSTSDSLTVLPTSDPIVTAKNNHIKRANTLLSKSLHTEPIGQQLNNFLSNNQTDLQLESFLSRTQLEITPELINRLNRNQPTSQRRVPVKWVKRTASLHNTTNPHANSLNEFHVLPIMENNNMKEDIQIIPSMSIPDIATNDPDDMYQNYIEKVNDDNDDKMKCTASSASSDNEDEEDTNNTNNNINSIEDVNQEHVESTRVFVDQENQTMLAESKSRKKNKSSHRKKNKSTSKKTKQPNTIPNSPSILLSSSTSHILPTNDTTASASPVRISTSVTKQEETNTAKSLITVDTSKARSNLPVVRLCLRELGWKECCHSTNADSDIYWHSASFHEGDTNFSLSSGRVNKFPGMCDLLRKVHLTRLLNYMRSLFPHEYDFYPKTWFLPEQSQQFKDDVRYIHQLDKKHNRSLTTFIVKPSDGSQGEGIYLLRDPSHIVTSNRAHVIQEYIDKPLLMDGLKFDLRIYVLILNLYPLEVYLYDEGLARFATVDYKAPSSDNLHQTFMHLTNYSLNKRSASYKHPIDDKQADGSKRKLTVVWKQLSDMFSIERIEQTKELVVELINKTILAILPELRVNYEFELPPAKRQNLSCFQIVGFDIILTDHLKPILLEVNANPSLRIDFDKNVGGKIIYHLSPIDEEIKKPLVLETLKLALPKKKLETIARHAQFQANEGIMTQRVEKLAQRRVEERNEKIKSARKTRFDMKLNPFFSRPLESIAKEFARQQHEQPKPHNSSPTHPIILTQSFEDLSAYVYRQNYNQPLESTRGLDKKGKHAQHSIDTEDNTDNGNDQSGSPPITAVSDIVSSANIRQASTKSGISRTSSSAMDAMMIQSISSLKLIFSNDRKAKYQLLFLIDSIAYIYIQLVVSPGYKTMTSAQFRSFAGICGIISEAITAPTIDVLYCQMLKKWQQFVMRTTLTGLPFAAFIEAFFLLSQRKYPNAQSLFESVNHLIHVCLHHLNPTMPRPISPIIYQVNPHQSHRSKKSQNLANSTQLNIQTSITALRSSTSTSIHRSVVVPTSAPTSRNPKAHPSSSAKPMDNKNKQSSPNGSAKSVFPLFFDVL